MISSTTADVSADSLDSRVFRVEVWPRPGETDPIATQVLPEARSALPAITAISCARVYLIEAPLDERALCQIAERLLADPVNQSAVLGARPVAEHAATVEVHYLPGVMDPVAQSTREAIGEMLPQLAIDQIEVRTGLRYDLEQGPSPRWANRESLHRFAEAALANPVIQDIHTEPFWPDRFPRGRACEPSVTHIPIRDLDDPALMRLSRKAHLFLNLQEMRAIRDHCRARGSGGSGATGDAGEPGGMSGPGVAPEPTDIELETLAQTWSEHCVHKTFKSTISYRQIGDGGATPGPTDWLDRPNHTLRDDGLLIIANLLESTIAAATRKLMDTSPHRDWCVSVFADNAGIVKFDEEDGVCIKVETHNHPTAIEPYGGAATGIGGCIRDVLGTGRAARPVANTDTFCVAWQPESKIESQPSTDDGEPPDIGSGGPDSPLSTPGTRLDLPKGVIAPRRILRQVVAGVRDYGNRMGIPTVNGAVYFHDDYVGNPLVFAGCVGLLPLTQCFGEVRVGDRIVVLGGATGRDGIHGATFSSAALTDSHADEFSHAVQIGNPITQKKMMDVILQARDHPEGCLFNAITDCGAGGLSSAVGEMARKIGAFVRLENAPLKYQGLSYTEIWISEAQERMVLAVPPDKAQTLGELCAGEQVGFCDLGQFGWPAEGPGGPLLVLTYHTTEVGRLSMQFLHEGIPTDTRQALWTPGPKPTGQSDHVAGSVNEVKEQTTVASRGTSGPARSSIGDALFALLAHPNIASKHWIIRQYDHEVQGGSVIKPLVGPGQDGPSDAAVLRPKLTSQRGIALACGLQPHLSEKATATGLAADGDSYWATLAAIDEAVRNAVCVGADPDYIALLDNFCWPSCDDPHQLGALVRAAEACYDGALAYRTPFVSGKDSLNNQFITEGGQVIAIPQTLLITALGIVKDVMRCRSMDAKAAGNGLLMIGRTTPALGGSHYRMVTGDDGRNDAIPRVDLASGPENAKAVARLISQGLVASAHDCSDGGLLVAAAEMAFAGRIGLDLDLEGLLDDAPLDSVTACFAETPSRYLIEVRPDKLDAVIRSLRESAVLFDQVGRFVADLQLTVRTPGDGRVLSAPLDDLRCAWRGPLDW